MEKHNAAVLHRMLDARAFDVVSAWHMGAMSLGLLTDIAQRKIPIASLIYDDWLVYGPTVDAWMRPFARHRVAGRIVGTLTGLPTRIAIDGPDVTLVFASQWLRKRAHTRSPLALPARETVVHGGVDHSDFSAPEAPRPWRWRLLCVGRVEQRKGVHVAIEALASLPSEATLDVIGAWDEPYKAELDALATRLSVADRVHLIGPVPRGELASRYRDADLFVFPVVWDEPFGIVPLEAMACGTPVVGTGTGGSSEFLLDEVNCLRITPGDPTSLAQAVRRLADDEGLRTQIVAAGRRTAAYLTDERFLDTLLEWHIAAAHRYANGAPPEQPPLVSRIDP
jgi:glycosyltransferase involved in cell wall biosynthesis